MPSNPLYILAILTLLLACKNEPVSDQDPIARVNDRYLYPEDLGVFGSEVDSAAWNQGHIDMWIARQLWANQAEKEEGNPKLEKLVEDYRQSLLISAYKEKLIANAKIMVSEEEVLNYYKENEEQYTLTSELFQLRYYILDEGMGEDEILKRLNNDESSEVLQEFCSTSPSRCLTVATWVDKGVLEAIDLPSYLWSTSTKFKQFYRNDERIGLYQIVAKKKVGEPAPLDMVREEIQEVLFFQKEKEIIQKQEEKLLLNDQNKNEIEIY